MDRTDQDLVEAACCGDVDSFGELYRRYFRMATGIARSCLSDPHLAEDAAQEAFAIACRSLTTLQDRNQFPQWLGTICRRAATKLANAQPKYALLRDDVERSIQPGGESAFHDLHVALAKLDETEREIIMLHYFSELSYVEIGRLMELSTQAIHGRLQRARRKLANLLATSGVRQ